MSEEQTNSETQSSQQDATSLVNQPTQTTEGTEKPEVKTEGEKPAEATLLSADDFKDFEGFDANDPHTKSFMDLMNGEMSAKERATKLLELQRDVMKDLSEKGTQAFNQMREDWRKEVSADPEFSGGKLQPALGGISKLVDRFGDAATRDAFDLTGAGDNPAIIKFLHKIANVLNESTGEPGIVRPPAAPKSAAELLYPNQGKQ